MVSRRWRSGRCLRSRTSRADPPPPRGDSPQSTQRARRKAGGFVWRRGAGEESHHVMGRRSCWTVVRKNIVREHVQRKEWNMRCLVLLKADAHSEAGTPPTKEMME